MSDKDYIVGNTRTGWQEIEAAGKRAKRQFLDKPFKSFLNFTHTYVTRRHQANLEDSNAQFTIARKSLKYPGQEDYLDTNQLAELVYYQAQRVRRVELAKANLEGRASDYGLVGFLAGIVCIIAMPYLPFIGAALVGASVLGVVVDAVKSWRNDKRSAIFGEAEKNTFLKDVNERGLSKAEAMDLVHQRVSSRNQQENGKKKEETAGKNVQKTTDKANELSSSKKEVSADAITSKQHFQEKLKQENKNSKEREM